MDTIMNYSRSTTAVGALFCFALSCGAADFFLKDGDRVVMADSQGTLVDGDELLYILAVARKNAGTLVGGVVGTVMTNLGLELALAEHGIAFERSPVGDRHIHRALIRNGWKLGGEASGHLLCLDRTSTGDGVVSALQVLEVMVTTDKSLSELRVFHQ